MANGLTQTNKIARGSYAEQERARESQREVERRCIDIQTTCTRTDRQANGWTDGRTLLVPKVAIVTEKVLNSVKAGGFISEAD